MNYHRQLSKYTNDVLGQLCVVCGYPVKPRKQDKIDAIANGVQMVSTLPAKINVLAIDVGIKNLSYCKLTQIGVRETERPMLDTRRWKKIDLHEQYGARYRPLTNDMTSLVDSKRYLSHLAFELVKDVVAGQEDTPHVIVVENQRTRSNKLLSTLPNVLLNYTFENMVYSTIWTLQQHKKAKLRDTVVIPMNASKMIYFWLNRFIDCPKSMQTKKLRIQLFFNWLYANDSPFVHALELPDTFREFTSLQKSRYLLKELDLPVLNNKIDDLIDSLLYALTTHRVLQNQHLLLDYLQSNGDLSAFIEAVNNQHFKLIQKVILDNDLQLLQKKPPRTTKKKVILTSPISEL